MVTQSLSETEDVRGSKRRLVSLYVVRPQFSMAPDWKSGIAIKSEREKTDQETGRDGSDGHFEKD